MSISKNRTKNSVQEHSQAKLDFYRDYLEKYLLVLLNDKYTNEINIYDVFCGIGIYSDGKAGSPIVAMEIIKKLLKKYSSKTITLTINDKDKSKIDFVKGYINKHYVDICKVNTYNLDAKEMFAIVNKNIEHNKKGRKNLLFIDPYGYKEIYKNDICNIMQNQNSEIIIFLSIAQMYRFSKVALFDEENKSYEHLKRFIEDFFDQDHDICNGKFENQLEYINFIKEGFSDACKKKYFSASYSIQRDNKNYYALFFITNHIYGLDRIIETKWKLDNNCGKGFQKRKTHLFSDVYEEESQENCMEIFERKLRKYLHEERNNKEIYEFSLKSGYRPKHANDILKKLNLKFDREIRKNAYYLSYKYYKDKTIKYKVKIDG